MNRFSSLGRSLAARPRSATAITVMLALPLIAWSSSFLAVQSVSLSPADITSGGSSTGTVNLDGPTTTKVTSVFLTSANPGIVTVPSSVSFILRQQSKTFTAQSVSGAFGCTHVSARLGTTAPRLAQIAVHPVATSAGAPVHLTLTSGTVVGSLSTTGRVTVFGTLPGVVTVQLSSSAGATVPSSVNVTVTQTESGSIGAASFPIQTSTTGTTLCPIITATLGANTSRRLLKVVGISG